MAQILCFARSRRTWAAFSNAISIAGHDPLRCRSVAAAVRRVRTTPIAALVVEYCREDRHFRDFLTKVKRRRDVPVIVVSRQVVQAFQVAGSLADLYLEEPVAQAELVGFVNVLAVLESSLPATQPSTSSAAGTEPAQQTKFPAAPTARDLLKPAAAAAH